MLRRAALGVGAAGAVGGGVAWADPGTAESAARFGRTARVVAAASLRYRWLQWRGLEPSQHSQELRRLQERVAVDVRALCQQHGGLYAKLGQVLATMNHVLPPEVTDTLRVLQDKTRAAPFPLVRRMVAEELGAPLEELFVRFEEAPIASASLAQVHRATLPARGDAGEREVAVKVQFPRLEREVEGDLWTLRVFTRLVCWAYPDMGALSWVLPEFEESTRLELDFRQEAANADRIRRLVGAEADVHVPEVVRGGYTTRRVLTMEYIDGCRATDQSGLAALGVDPRAVASTILRVWGDLIHVYGFVHCDPHPGNIMVRRDPQHGGVQVVILDHGMYRRLDGHFRAAYCLLWKSLLLGSESLGLRALRALQLPSEYLDIFSLIFTYRPGGGGTRLGNRMSVEERAKLRERFRDWDKSNTSEFVRQLPRDLLFVMRTTSIIRSINKDLGGTSRERFRLLGASAIKGLALVPDEEVLSGALIVDAEVLNRPSVSYALINEPVTAELRGPLTLRDHFRYRLELWTARLTLAVVDVGMLLWEWWRPPTIPPPRSAFRPAQKG